MSTICKTTVERLGKKKWTQEDTHVDPKVRSLTHSKQKNKQE